MGSMRGDLSLIGLADLFQLLAAHRRIGTLSIADADSRKSIYFGKDGLMLLSDGKRKGPRLGELLLRTRRLTAQQIDRVASVQKQWKARFGEAVVKLGYLTRDEMMRAVREQVEEEIYDLFSWSDATFEFTEGPPPAVLVDPDQPVAVLTLDVTALILEALRRIDEWQIISKPLGGTDAVFSLTEQAAEKAAAYANDPLLLNVVQLIDGNRTVSQIVDAVRASRFQVYRAMFQLHQDGCLQQVRAATAPVSAAPPPAPGASRDTDRLRRAAGAPRTVVVLGGTAAFRRELCEDLRKAGCEAVEALNDQTVLDLVRNQAVHAILLDASADLQPAWGALLHLNAMTNVPVIVMSPNRAREDIIQTIKHGARDYIVKPFARSYLLDRLLRIWEPDAPRQTETMIMRRATGEEKRN